MSVQLRQHKRFIVCWPALMASLDNTFSSTAFIYNFSESGVYLKTNKELPLDVINYNLFIQNLNFGVYNKTQVQLKRLESIKNYGFEFKLNKSSSKFKTLLKWQVKYHNTSPLSQANP